MKLNNEASKNGQSKTTKNERESERERKEKKKLKNDWRTSLVAAMLWLWLCYTNTK